MLLRNTSYLPRNYAYLRRMLMRSVAESSTLKLEIHSLSNLVTFSIKSDTHQESYPYFFSNLGELQHEAVSFLKEYNITIVDFHEPKKEFTLSY